MAALNAVEAVRRTEAGRDEPLRVTVDDAERAIPALVEALEDCGATIGAVAPYQPTFDEVFIRLIERRGRRPPPDGAVHTSAGAGEGRGSAMLALYQTLAIAIKELRELLRRPALIVTLIFGPLAIMLLFGIGTKTVAEPPRAVVVLPPGEGSRRCWRRTGRRSSTS